MMPYARTNIQEVAVAHIIKQYTTLWSDWIERYFTGNTF
jgi:hypothetical protein